MRSSTLDRVIDLLNKLDTTDYVKITYDEKECLVNLTQRGKIILLTPLQGLMIPVKKGILFPEDLVELINRLVFLRSYDQDYLIAPKKMGFRVYARNLRGNNPKILMDLDFCSYSSKLSLWIASIMREEVKRCLKY